MISFDKLAVQVLSLSDMGLKITPEVRKFYKQLASAGGQARAKKYDRATLSEWAKMGGRPKKKQSAAKKRGERGRK
jgi:hypothetical protein